MKKFLALLLAVIMCLSMFAGCKDDKEPAKDPAKDPDSGKTDDQPENPSGGTQTNPPATDDTKVKAILDATDGLTIAIQNRGETTGANRIGIVADEGTVQISTYNLAGSRRKESYVFKWADLGLEGEAWEYLGATFEIDVTDEANPKIIAKPTAKTTFVYEGRKAIPFEGEDKLKLPIGTFDIIGKLSHCGFNGKNLINESGEYIVKWGDKFPAGKSSPKWDENSDRIWTMFLYCEQFDQLAYVPVDKHPSQYSAAYEAPSPDTMTKVFGFSGYMFGTFNTLGTLEAMLKEGLGKDVFKTTKYLGHTSSSTTWNLHELFAEEARQDPDSITFGTGTSGQDVKTWLSENSYDYVVLQAGRDVTLTSGTDMRGIYSATKLAKLAVEKNPNCKIVIVAPYGHNATYPDTPSVKNHTEHTALINAEAQKTVDSIKAAGITNVVMVSVADCFEAYVAQGGNIADLFQANDGLETRKNAGNRASAKGAYITAAAIYTAMTGKSPVGLATVGEEALSGDYTCAIDAADAGKLQTLVEGVVLGAMAG